LDSTTTSNDGNVIDLGRIRYETAWELQRKLHAQRVSGEIPDTLLLLEHEPVFTLGKSGREENVLIPKSLLEQKGIEFFRVERGGDITYHGPGQLVGYPIFILKERLTGIRRFIEKIEQAVIEALDDYGIKAATRPRNVGVWVDNRKIASVGIAVRQWVTFHGFALNVNTDLEYFKMILPCGLKGVAMTSMQKELGKSVPMSGVKAGIRSAFSRVFSIAFGEKQSLTRNYLSVD